MNSVADAYARGAEAWADGPSRVYGPLAELLVAFSPEPLAGQLVLDHGSGTGLGTLAAQAVGARVIACDITPEMLEFRRAQRPPAIAADVGALPLRGGAVDAVLACFSLNHFRDPAVGVREAGRVAPLLLASTYADDDEHPVKDAVDLAMTEAGWQRPEWYASVKAAMKAWGTVDLATAVIQRGGLHPVRVEHIEVSFDRLTPEELVAWRLGLAHTSSALAGLPPARQREVCERALELLGPDPEPLVRKVIFLAAIRPPA